MKDQTVITHWMTQLKNYKKCKVKKLTSSTKCDIIICKNSKKLFDKINFKE